VLTLTGGCPPLRSLGITRCAVDERVTVPAGTRVGVTSSTGDLLATDLAAPDLEAHLTRGSINASFARAPSRISVRVDAGRLRLTVPAATYAVDAAPPATPATSPWRSPPTRPRPAGSRPASPAATSRSGPASARQRVAWLAATPTVRGDRRCNRSAMGPGFRQVNTPSAAGGFGTR
jgi:hypothetical protein